MTGGTTEAGTAAEPSVITLLIENPGKGKNWGPLLRCCAAFGIETIYVVGYDQCDVRGSHGASKHVRLEAFPTHEQAAKALTGPLEESNLGEFELVGLLPSPLGLNEEDDDEDAFDRDQTVIREHFFYEPADKEVEIARIPARESGNKISDVGIETSEVTNDTDGWKRTSFPVHNRARFPKRTCLVVDKLKRGLPWALAKHCATFIHIPHVNTNPSGSMLTLEASISVIFHEAMNAGLVGHTTKNSMDVDASFSTSNYEGQKYHVEKVHKGSNDAETRQRKRKEREDKMKELQDETDDAEQVQSMLFGGNSNDGDY